MDILARNPSGRRIPAAGTALAQAAGDGRWPCVPPPRPIDKSDLPLPRGALSDEWSRKRRREWLRVTSGRDSCGAAGCFIR